MQYYKNEADAANEDVIPVGERCRPHGRRLGGGAPGLGEEDRGVLGLGFLPGPLQSSGYLRFLFDYSYDLRTEKIKRWVGAPPFSFLGALSAGKIVV